MRPTRTQPVLGAICGVALALVAAASPTPDVHGYLAEPAGADWVESGPSSDVLAGPVTAQSYDTWATDDGASADALKRDGFVTGYARAWAQKVTQDFLDEFVLLFDAPSGATSWFNDLKLFDETSKYYTKEIPAPSTPQAVGVEWTFPDGSHEYAIEFAKGNLFYDVTMDADTADLAAATLAQAQAELEMAPDSVNLSVTSNKLSPSLAWALGLSGSIFIVVVLVVAFLAFRSMQRPAASPLSAQRPQFSPDGNYWWDGQRWRFVATDPPPLPR